MGATFAELPLVASSVITMTVAFVGSVAMWWIYFVANAEAGTRVISESSDPGRIGRVAYTYSHVPIVAGIVLMAVGDELVLAHPNGHISPQLVLTVLGGPLLFVIGNLLFKWLVTGRVPASHVVGALLLGALALTSGLLSPLWLALLATAALVGVGVWEGTVTTAIGNTAGGFN